MYQELKFLPEKILFPNRYFDPLEKKVSWAAEGWGEILKTFYKEHLKTRSCAGTIRRHKKGKINPHTTIQGRIFFPYIASCKPLLAVKKRSDVGGHNLANR